MYDPYTLHIERLPFPHRAVQEESSMIAGKIKEMKLRSGMTNQQVADKSGVPIGTVNRVMADQVQNPNFETISAIVMALGGSIDEVVGHTPTVAAPVETAEPEKSSQPSQAVAQERPQQKESTPDHVSSDLVRGYEMLLKERLKVIAAKNQLLEEKNQWIKRLFILCCILGAMIIEVLLFDVVNPNLGFFQH